MLEGVTLVEHVNLQARFCQVFPPGDRNWFAPYSGIVHLGPDKD